MSGDDDDLEWFHCPECDASFLSEKSLYAHSHVHK